jgi:methionyl-tRNA synthetase
VDRTKHWELAKDPAERPRLDAVLLTLADALGCLGILLDPFVPDAAAKIRAAVDRRGPARLGDAVLGGLPALPRVQKLPGLFPRIDARPAPAGDLAPAGGGPGPARPRVAIDDFARIELRVAQVLAAEPVAKSKKLLKLSVDLGEAAPRTIVAGIAEHYAPAELVGKKVVVVANLEPARLMGVESDGMLLAGSTDGRLAVLSLDRDLPPGCRVK